MVKPIMSIFKEIAFSLIRSNHDFCTSDLKLNLKIRQQELFENIDLGFKKPFKMEVKIHKKRSKIDYLRLSKIFFEKCGFREKSVLDL